MKSSWFGVIYRACVPRTTYSDSENITTNTHLVPTTMGQMALAAGCCLIELRLWSTSRKEFGSLKANTKMPPWAPLRQALRKWNKKMKLGWGPFSRFAADKITICLLFLSRLLSSERPRLSLSSPWDKEKTFHWILKIWNVKAKEVDLEFSIQE